MTINSKDRLSINELITRHNNTVKAFKECKVKPTTETFFPLMQVSTCIAFEGQTIVEIARSVGINVKCNMQGGEIIYYNQVFFYEVTFEDSQSKFIKSGDCKLSLETAIAFLQDEIDHHGKIIKIDPTTQEEVERLCGPWKHTDWPLIG